MTTEGNCQNVKHPSLVNPSDLRDFISDDVVLLLLSEVFLFFPSLCCLVFGLVSGRILSLEIPFVDLTPTKRYHKKNYVRI